MSKDEKSSKNLKQGNSDYKKAHDKWVKEVLEPALAKHPERNKKFMYTLSLHDALPINRKSVV